LLIVVAFVGIDLLVIVGGLEEYTADSGDLRHHSSSRDQVPLVARRLAWRLRVRHPIR
jgi:hypothetical protein